MAEYAPTILFPLRLSAPSVRAAHYFVKATAVITIVVASLVLVGWRFDLEFLIGLRPNWITVKVNTAIALIFAGASLWLLLPEKGSPLRRKVRMCCATVTLLIGALTVCQYLFGWDLGIDQAIFPEEPGAVLTSTLGRMPPATAISLMMLGLAILLIDMPFKSRWHPTSFLCALTATITFTAILRYVYDVEELIGVTKYTIIALRPAILLFCLSLAILMTRPVQGFIAVAISDTLGGQLLRRALPAILIALVLFGGARVIGARLNLFPPDLGIILVLNATFASFAFIIWRNAATINRLAQEKRDQQLEQLYLETQAKRNLLEAIITNSPASIILSRGPDAIVEVINSPAKRLFSFEISEGHPAYKQAPPQIGSELLSEYRQLLRAARPRRLVDRPMGNSFYTTVDVPISLPDGENGLLTIGVDTTAQVKLRQALAEEGAQRLLQEQSARTAAEQNVRMRDDFISVASHELRNPLSALRIQCQIIARILAGHADARLTELSNKSLRQIDALVTLIDNLLDVTRIGANRLTLNRSVTNLSEVARGVIERLKPEMEQAGCALHTVLADDVAGVWDQPRIEQVIVNLVTNAIKYGAAKPIEISTVREGDIARLYVKDHGIGISTADQKKLFTRFGRAEGVSQFHGLGLGLYIAHEIVHAHGGKLRVESELGKGSTFIVELPSGQIQ